MNSHAQLKFLAQVFTASDVGYWFSPKSGRILAPGQTNFILPALRKEPVQGRPPMRNSKGLNSKKGLESGCRWGFAYGRGQVRIYFSAPSGPLELLNVVKLGMHSGDGPSLCRFTPQLLSSQRFLLKSSDWGHLRFLFDASMLCM